ALIQKNNNSLNIFNKSILTIQDAFFAVVKKQENIFSKKISQGGRDLTHSMYILMKIMIRQKIIVSQKGSSGKIDSIALIQKNNNSLNIFNKSILTIQDAFFVLVPFILWAKKYPS
ncbi:hypothetical protein, partial [uncultured Microscilla sp.]|uniref:hypothetical protein n=1 Tax=uncultured Microscilla sp. TaxID=432653 RepID=UPI00262EEF02